METIVGTGTKMHETLISLRQRASELASQSEDEFLLADIVAMLSGKKLPCTHTKEEFANVLSEAEEDFKAGRFVTQDELRAKYDL